MDGFSQKGDRRWWLDLPIACTAEFRACVRRICSWPVPQNWGAADWFEEICAVAAAAACDAESRFNPAYGVVLDAYVHSRVLNRALTRYRQEWAFSSRFMGGYEDERNEEARERAEAWLAFVLDGNPACDCLLEAMTGLRDRDRWLLKQIFWEDRTEAKIGHELGISQRAVSKRKQAVLRSLGQLLNPASKKSSAPVLKVDARRNPLSDTVTHWSRTTTKGRAVV